MSWKLFLTRLNFLKVILNLTIKIDQYRLKYFGILINIDKGINPRTSLKTKKLTQIVLSKLKYSTYTLQENNIVSHTPFNGIL